MYGINGVEKRKRDILTELPIKNSEIGYLTNGRHSNASADEDHLPVIQNQASPQLMRPPRNYTGEMMSSLLVPTIGLLLMGAPIKGTLLAYVVLSGSAGVLQTMVNVACDLQHDFSKRISNTPKRISIFSSEQNNLETSIVGPMHSLSRQ